MKYFKKYPIFFALMAVLLLVFVLGVAGNIYFALQSSNADKALKAEMRKYSSALNEDPTQVALDASEANINRLQERLEFLEQDLTRASGDIFKELADNKGYELTEQLRGLVNRWRKTAKSKDILVDNEMDFGYKKYVAPGAKAPKDEAVEAIWRQACVMDYINKKLFNCKPQETLAPGEKPKFPMTILAVQRELLPEEAEPETAQSRRRAARTVRKDDTTGDNFKIESSITARKPGSLNTIAYRFIFTGHTDVLRRFLNQLKDFDAMLVVRSIDVKPADPTLNDTIMMKNNPASVEDVMFGADMDLSIGADSIDPNFGENGEIMEGQPEQDASIIPVVTDNISEFTVVIEYVEVVKDAPKAEQKNAEDSDETEK